MFFHSPSSLKKLTAHGALPIPVMGHAVMVVCVLVGAVFLSKKVIKGACDSCEVHGPLVMFGSFRVCESCNKRLSKAYHDDYMDLFRDVFKGFKKTFDTDIDIS